jgi:NCAIR mutase (PurE)-related protein
VNSEADEQFELLNQFLNQDISKSGSAPGSSGIEQPDDLLSFSEERQEGYPAITHGASSTIDVRPDPAREQRKGVPEVIFGETKASAQVVTMAQALLEGAGRAIISRVRPDTLDALRVAFPKHRMRLKDTARAVVIYEPGYIRPATGGHVGVISAGTSDIPVAEEAALIAEEMGCHVTCIYDVGVAGLHRLVGPLRGLLSTGVDAIIVAAGMDGALPSVVAGLVPVPVIGLPTSIGYGLGGRGIAALLSMLQTCAPGLAVVNIDNGIGAGSTAALIANRVAQAREHREHQSQ